MSDPLPPAADGPTTEVEREVAALLGAAQVDEATALVLRSFGAELLGFLRGITRSPDAADEAFSVLSVAVWRSLPGFAWRSSLRTWVYVLARRAVARVARGLRRDEVPLSQASALDVLVAEVRATTLPQLAPVRDGFAALRAQLDPDDQVLLVLRVDRELPWRDIAQVLAEDGDDDEEVARIAATLRKRFERVKGRIRTLARQAGLAE